MFPPRYTHRIYLLYGLLFYVLAKLGELYDGEIFRLTGDTLSGHSLKHLLAACSPLCIYLMLLHRRRVI